MKFKLNASLNKGPDHACVKICLAVLFKVSVLIKSHKCVVPCIFIDVYSYILFELVAHVIQHLSRNSAFSVIVVSTHLHHTKNVFILFQKTSSYYSTVILTHHYMLDLIPIDSIEILYEKGIYALHSWIVQRLFFKMINKMHTGTSVYTCSIYGLIITCRPSMVYLFFVRMLRVVRISTYVVVYSLMTILGHAILPVENRVFISRSMRLSLSALQVCLLCALFGVYMTAMSIANVIQGSRKRYKLALEEELESLQSKHDGNDDSKHCEDVDNVHLSVDEIVNETQVQEKSESDKKTACDETREILEANERAIFESPRWVHSKAKHLVSPVAAVDCLSPRHEVLFATEKDLSVYVLKIHAMGLALWETYLCFDCSTSDINMAFLYGLVTGWLGRCIALQDLNRAIIASLYTATCFTVLMSQQNVIHSGLVRVEGMSKWSHARELFNLVALPFMTGVFWTFAVTSKQLVLDARRSILTLVLISVTFPLYWTVIDQAILQSVIESIPRNSFVFIIMFEPILKTVGVLVMLHAIQNHHTVDLVVSLVLVVAISTIVYKQMTTPIHMCAIAVLSLMHLVCSVVGMV